MNPGWQAALLRRLQRELGQQPRRAGMAGVGLANHGIAGRNGRDEIATGDRIERKREIVRPEHRDRSGERRVAGSDVRLRIDRRVTPGSIASRVRALTQLIRRSRQFDVMQPRRERPAPSRARPSRPAVGPQPQSRPRRRRETPRFGPLPQGVSSMPVPRRGRRRMPGQLRRRKKPGTGRVAASGSPGWSR